MKVTFHKTGARRYRVSIARELRPDLTHVGAPGYDEWLPHDLLHFVAEAVWEMRGGVFAGLAASDDPSGFFPADPALVAKWMRRRRREKGKPHPKGRRSELLAGVLHQAWRQRRLGADLPADWEERLSAARADAPRLERALAWCDELAPAWHELSVGGSLTLEWPLPESGGPRRRAARGTRAAPRASAGGAVRRGARS